MQKNTEVLKKPLKNLLLYTCHCGVSLWECSNLHVNQPDFIIAELYDSPLIFI